MLRQLSVPLEVRVIAGEDGSPVAITFRGKARQVSYLRNCWRVDEEWWRNEISRQYFEVDMDDGLIRTVFHDLVSDRWYQQKY